MSVPVLESHTKAAQAASSSITVNKPSGVVSGDLLLIIVFSDDVTDTAQFSDNLTGWNFQAEGGDSAADVHMGVFWRGADGTEGASETIDAASSDDMCAFYLRISGADTTTPFDLSPSIQTDAGAGVHTIPEITTNNANSLALYAIATDGQDTAPYDSVSWTGGSEVDNNTVGTGGDGLACSFGTKGMATAGATGDVSVDLAAALSDGAVYVQFAINEGAAPSGITLTPTDIPEIEIELPEGVAVTTGITLTPTDIPVLRLQPQPVVLGVGSAETPTIDAGSRTVLSTGVQFEVLYADPNAFIAIERALDDGAGAPDTSTSSFLLLQPATRFFTDRLPLDGQTRWYRGRHQIAGHLPSAWTAWVPRVPINLSPATPSPTPYPIITIIVDEVKGEPENARIRLRAWPDHPAMVIRYAVLDDTDTVPSPSRSTSDWTVYSGAFKVARDAVNPRKVAAFGDLNFVGEKPVALAEIGPHVVPEILSMNIVFDFGSVSAAIQSNAGTGSVKVAASTTGFPDEATVLAQTALNGRNVVTGELLDVTPGQLVFLSAIPFSAADGGGAQGPLAQAKLGWIPNPSIDPIGKNQALNGTFEDGGRHWASGNQAEADRLAIDTATPLSGFRSLKITSDSGGNTRVFQTTRVTDKINTVGERRLVPVLPGEVWSITADVKAQSDQGVQFKFVTYDDVGTLIGSVFAGTGGTTTTKRFTKKFTIPAGIFFINLEFFINTDASGPRDFFIDNVKVTKIEQAIDIDDAIVTDGGDLDSDVGMDEGGVGSFPLLRHPESAVVQDASGEAAFTFPAAYENVPFVLLIPHQLIAFNSSLGTASDQYLRLQAVNLSPSGGTARAVNVQPGAITQQEDDFPSLNTLDTEGETTEVNLANAPANDDRYEISFDVSVTAGGTLGTGKIVSTLVLAIDSNDGGGWVERWAKTYKAVDPGESPTTKTWDNETVAIIVSGLGANDDIRIRAKSFDVTGDPNGEGFFSVHGHNKATDGDSPAGAAYTTATDTVESAMPNAEDGVRYYAQEGV